MPDLNDFVGGMKILLAPGGVITMEFPHLLQLIELDQFDTIYHEHFSYFSFLTVSRVFEAHGLRLWDVEEIPTHGGSLRIYGCHADDGDEAAERPRGRGCSMRERRAGLDDLGVYREFARAHAGATSAAILSFLIDLKAQGKSIVGYGAPAKGNTLLNFCGIGTDFLDYTVDQNPHKQGHLLPGHAHPDPPGRGAARDAARRRAHPALEPARRDRRRARATCGSGAGSSRRAPPSCALLP